MKPMIYQTWTEDKSEKIESILIDLGYQLVDRGKYWQSAALYRDGDNKTALQIWKDSGTWKDFVKGTGYLPFKKLIELSCEDDTIVNDALETLNKKEDSFLEFKKAPKMNVEQFFDHSEVKTLLPIFKFYNAKGISDSVLKLYQGGFSMSGKMNGRFVFPVFNINEKLVGITGRHLLWENNSNFAKWKHCGRKSNWVYPAFLPQYKEKFYDSLDQSREIIIVESIGDSLALSEQGVYNHIVSFGLDLSSKQISFLHSLPLDKIIIATNNDTNKSVNRGREAAIKMFLKLIKSFDISKVQIKLPLKSKDFGEMLESGVGISAWVDKKVNRVFQLNYILKSISEQEWSKQKNSKLIKIIKNHIEELNLELEPNPFVQ